jgi:pimeloyl-ACP methyl ester carboxylesterase
MFTFKDVLLSDRLEQRPEYSPECKERVMRCIVPIARVCTFAALFLIVVSGCDNDTTGPSDTEKGSVSGTVKDVQNEDPIEGAHVVVESTDLSDDTDSTGYYLIEDVPPGSYTITATKTGYDPSTFEGQTVSEGDTTEVSFTLVPSEPSDYGTVEIISIAGNCIAGWREASVYLPASYEPCNAYPVVYLLHGFGGDHTTWVEETGIAAILDQLIADGDIVPMIVVMPDGSNLLGGSFYANSYDEVHDLPGFGNYSDYLIQEVVGAVDTLYNTIKDPAGRAIDGLSMGGYGAFRNALDYPDMFGSVSCHSGPIAFYGTCALVPPVCPPDPLSYPGLLTLAEAMIAENQVVDGQLIVDFPSLGDGFHNLSAMFVALSMAFSPNMEDPSFPILVPWQGVDLPLSDLFLTDDDGNGIVEGLEDSVTVAGDQVEWGVPDGVIDGLEDARDADGNPVQDGYPDGVVPDIWDRWLNNDVLTLILTSPDHQAAVQQLHIYFDCGLQDELGLNYQSDILAEVLQGFGVDFVYNTFDGGHSDKIHEWIDESLLFHSNFFTEE